MNIKEALKELHTMNVKIGCKDGSGFFYVGELNADTLEEGEQNIIETNKRLYDTADRLFNEAKNGSPRPCDYIHRLLKETEGKPITATLEGWQDYQRSYFKRVNGTYRRRYNCEQRILTHVPLEEREVVESYESIDEPSCHIILVEGSDFGMWWTMGEYEKGFES